MVLALIKKSGRWLILLLLMIQSCEDLYIVDCDDCLDSEPHSCELLINIEETAQVNERQTITIYKGKIEDGIIIYTTLAQISAKLTVSLNSEYTVTSSFTNSQGITYTAVGSTRPKVKIKTDYCETTCYYIIDNSIDLRFKYFK